jgi:hypothetical protein
MKFAVFGSRPQRTAATGAITTALIHEYSSVRSGGHSHALDLGGRKRRTRKEHEQEQEPSLVSLANRRYQLLLRRCGPAIGELILLGGEKRPEKVSSCSMQHAMQYALCSQLEVDPSRLYHDGQDNDRRRFLKRCVGAEHFLTPRLTVSRTVRDSQYSTCTTAFWFLPIGSCSPQYLQELACGICTE